MASEPLADPRNADPMGPSPAPRHPAITPSAAVTSPRLTPPPRQPIPTSIGQYVVRRRIASGGMGDVFECVDERLGKSVAVKVSHTDLAADPGVLEQIRDEARRLASVRDRRYVLRVLSAGDVTIKGVDVPFVAMEFEADAEHLGGPLSNAWPVERKVAFFIKVCEAVQSLHEQHLVHADIKPSNILVVGDEPRLIDFGIARVVRRLGGEPGQIAGGTPGYLDPALLADPSLRPDQRTDIYCLGVTLAEFLAARSPEQPQTPGQQSWPSPTYPTSAHAPEVDPELDAIILRAAAHAPADRYQSVEALAAALSDWLAFHRSIPARLRETMARAGRTGARAAARWPVIGTGLVTLAAAVLAFALSPVMFRWTSAALITQPLAAHAEAPAPNLPSVRIIELRDAQRFAAAAAARGMNIPLDHPGSHRLIWAALARAIAESGGARVVGFDLMFYGEYPSDSKLRDAFLALAKTSECGSVVVGLEKWGDQLLPSLRDPNASGAIRAGCLNFHDGQSGAPLVAQLAVLEPDQAYALPSFAFLLAALAERPGWEPQIVVNVAKGIVHAEFARTDDTGVRRRHDSELILANQALQPLDDRYARNSAAGCTVAEFPVLPASDAAFVDAAMDAADALAMSPEDLRAWIGAHVVIVCDLRQPDKDQFLFRNRIINGPYLQASAVEALLSRRYLRVPSTPMSFFATLGAAVIGAVCAGFAVALSRNRARALVTLICVLFGILAVLTACSGGLHFAGQMQYFFNPLIVGLSALFAFAAVFALHARSLATARARTS